MQRKLSLEASCSFGWPEQQELSLLQLYFRLANLGIMSAEFERRVLTKAKPVNLPARSGRFLDLCGNVFSSQLMLPYAYRYMEEQRFELCVRISQAAELKLAKSQHESPDGAINIFYYLGSLVTLVRHSQRNVWKVDTCDGNDYWLFKGSRIFA